MRIKLAIGCRNYIFGEGLVRLLKDDKSINIVGIFDNGTGLKKISKLNPDVILTDLNIFIDLSGNPTICKQLNILLIDTSPPMFPIDDCIPNIFMRGVCGILSPNIDSALLKKAIRSIASGEIWIERKSIKNIFNSKDIHEKKKINFTDKEKEVVSLLCQGFRNKEIARKIYMSEQTVKSHCNRIYKKVGISDRLQFVLYCYRNTPHLINFANSRRVYNLKDEKE